MIKTKLFEMTIDSSITDTDSISLSIDDRINKFISDNNYTLVSITSVPTAGLLIIYDDNSTVMPLRANGRRQLNG